MLRQMAELNNIVEAGDTLINVGLQRALRPRGTPGDVAEIVFVARRLAAVYEHAIEWSLRVRRAHVKERVRPIINEMAVFSDSIVANIENYGPDLLRQFEEALAAPEDGRPQVIRATLVFELSNMNRFREESPGSCRRN